MIIFLELLLLLLFCLVMGIYVYFAGYAMISGAPYVPTSHVLVKRMIALAEIKPGEKIMDIGSGDGRIIFAAHEAGASGTGIEIMPFFIWFSKLKSYLLRIPRVQFLRTNFWQISFQDVDVLFVYCIPGKMKKLEEKILHEMKPGTRIISHAFQFPTLTLVKQEGNIFVYELAKREGA